MNILIIGTIKNIENFYKTCLQSKYIEKIYMARAGTEYNLPEIKFKNFDELARKIQTLKITLTINFDENLMKNGITDFFRKKYLAIICSDKKWGNLHFSKLITKKLLSCYSFNVPQIIKAPTTFPVMIKADDLKNKQNSYVANSLNELIEYNEKLSQNSENIFVEEFLNGDKYTFIFLWDRNNLLMFPQQNKLSEVQEERVERLKTKLNFMLSDEKADFISFISINVIWAKNEWYIISVDTLPELYNDYDAFSGLNTDIIYILNAAIYQKLNEINI